jgi:membrane protein
MTKKPKGILQIWRKKLEARLDTMVWPGFEGLSMLIVGRFFIEALSKGSINTRAAAISFRLFLAFFPAIILLLSLIPFVPIPNFQKELMDSIHSFFPGETFALVEETLDDLINKKYSSLISIGFILVIYYASNSINAVLLGFDECYHFEDKTHPVLRRAISILLIFVLGIIMASAITLIVFSETIIGFIADKEILADKALVFTLDLAKWGITLILIYMVNTTLYNVGMGVRRRKAWKFWNVGAMMATLLFVTTSIGFAYFINNFAQFNKLYGSLGTLMVLLIWMNLNCIILLAGFDLNASIRKALKIHRAPAIKPVAEPIKETSKVEENKKEEHEAPLPIRNTFKS